jgi:hypothetical protein
MLALSGSPFLYLKSPVDKEKRWRERERGTQQFSDKTFTQNGSQYQIAPKRKGLRA